MAGASKGRTPHESGETKPSDDEDDGPQDRSGETLEDKKRRDQQAGDVADDLADFA